MLCGVEKSNAEKHEYKIINLIHVASLSIFSIHIMYKTLRGEETVKPPNGRRRGRWSVAGQDRHSA